MDKRLIALGNVGLSVAHGHNSDGNGEAHVSESIRSVLLAIKASCDGQFPIVMRPELMPHLQPELRDQLKLLDSPNPLPAACWLVSVSHDETTPFRSKFALSASLFHHFQQIFCMLVMPSLHPYPFVASSGCSFCKVFDGSVYPPDWRIPPFPLNQRIRPEKLISGSALIAGIKVSTAAAKCAIIHGTLADVAAGATLVQESEGVVTYLDGSHINWRHFVPSPLLFAANDNVATHFRASLMRQECAAAPT